MLHLMGLIVSLCLTVFLQAWKRRWFVLRSGRLSGEPDVLQYYKNQQSRRPIRTINLNMCEQVNTHCLFNFDFWVSEKNPTAVHQSALFFFFFFRWTPACRSRRRSWRAASCSTCGRGRGPGTWWPSPRRTWTAGCRPSVCSVASTPLMTVQPPTNTVDGRISAKTLKILSVCMDGWMDLCCFSFEMDQCGLCVSQCENKWEEERGRRTCRERETCTKMSSGWRVCVCKHCIIHNSVLFIRSFELCRVLGTPSLLPGTLILETLKLNYH